MSGPTMPIGSSASHSSERFPMALLARHRRQAMRNHGQSLERLSARGGLSWCEALAILEDRRWEPCDDAEERVRAIINSSVEF